MQPRVQHLNSLDATFLHFESPEMPMHVASLDLLELPAGYNGDFYEDAKAHIASRMHLAPLFTRKLALMPFELSNPVWVDDEDIDLDYHVRRIQLPKPGSWEQLERYVARLHSSLLDRSRPLWEFTIIEGLQSGQVALYAKVHHAGVDGGAAVALAKAVLDLEAAGRMVKAPRPRLRTNQYQLGIAELASAAVSNTVRQTVKFAKALPGFAQAIKSVVLPKTDDDGERRWLPNLNFLAPRTLFNVAITNQRAWAARTVPLAEAKAIAKATGATLNDVVLATCSGAMRKYLQEYDALPEKSMSAAIPVSLREEGDTRADNQVSMMLMTLASDVKDPLERLRAIAEASKKTKATMAAATASVPLDFPLIGAPWLMSGLASLYGRSRIANVIPPPANVVISNVPGPQAPLYFAGAKMLTYYPVSIPAHGMALNITVHSYDGDLDYGLIACRRAVPDVADLANYLVAEHRKLYAATHTTAVSNTPVATETAATVPSERARRTTKRSSKTKARTNASNVVAIDSARTTKRAPNNRSQAKQLAR
jgi:diacylglycerol O-acyltransferase / wax synthase